jgi:hypothetical protein
MVRTSGALAGLFAMALVAACGGDDDGEAEPDAGAAADAAPEPPGPGTVQVRVWASAHPLIGRTVAFHNPDGSLLGTELTDVDGRCRRDDVLPGSSITVDARPPQSNSPLLFTVVGLEPGDQPQIGFLGNHPGQVIGALQIGYTDIGATSYRFTTGGPLYTQAGPSTSHSGSIIDKTVRPGPVLDYLLMARDADELPTHEASATNVSFTPDDTTLVTAPAWTAVPRRTLSFESPYADTESGFVGVVPMRGPLGLGLFSFPFAGSGAIESPELSFATSFQLSYFARLPGDARIGFYENVSSLEDYTRDVQSAVGLPRLLSGAADFSDPSRPIVTMAADGSLSDATGGVLQVRWNDDGLFGRWLIVLPAAEEISFHTPELPAELADLLPPPAADLLEVEAAFIKIASDDYRDIINANDIAPARLCARDALCRFTDNQTD